MTRKGAAGAILKAGLAMIVFGIVVSLLHVLWLIAIAVGGFVCGCIATRNYVRIRQSDYEELE